MNTIPKMQGYSVFRVASSNDTVKDKLTATTHLETLQTDSPYEYDRKIYSLYSQSGYYKNDFLEMIMGTDPFFIDANTDTFKWDHSVPAEMNAISYIPEETVNKLSSLGQNGEPFALVFKRKSFYANDIIVSDRRFGQTFLVLDDGYPHAEGTVYTLQLTGERVDEFSVVDSRFIRVDQEFEAIDNIVGEFDQTLSGLDLGGAKITLVDGISSGYGFEHTITSWADARSMKYANGKPLDVNVFASVIPGDGATKTEILSTRWEPFIESEMKKAMMKRKVSRMIWGQGGESRSRGSKQEVRKHVLGIYHKIREYSNYVPFYNGQFSVNLVRETFGDMFYRRVDMKNRRVKLFTNESGMSLFRKANKDDLRDMGLNLVLDVHANAKNPMLKYEGYDMLFSMETGHVEISHLAELDTPQSQNDLMSNKKAPPIFFVFDVTNPNGGLQNNVREVRVKGNPSMTYGYVDGRRHHLGHAASQGMSSGNSEPGYKIWMEDRADYFIESLDKCVILEQVPA